MRILAIRVETADGTVTARTPMDEEDAAEFAVLLNVRGTRVQITGEELEELRFFFDECQRYLNPWSKGMRRDTEKAAPF